MTAKVRRRATPVRSSTVRCSTTPDGDRRARGRAAVPTQTQRAHAPGGSPRRTAASTIATIRAASKPSRSVMRRPHPRSSPYRTRRGGTGAGAAGQGVFRPAGEERRRGRTARPRGSASASISMAVSATGTPVRWASRPSKSATIAATPRRSAARRGRPGRRALAGAGEGVAAAGHAAAAAAAAASSSLAPARPARARSRRWGSRRRPPSAVAHVGGRGLGAVAGEDRRLQVGHQAAVAARRRRLPRGAVERRGLRSAARARRRRGRRASPRKPRRRPRPPRSGGRRAPLRASAPGRPPRPRAREQLRRCGARRRPRRPSRSPPTRSATFHASRCR